MFIHAHTLLKQILNILIDNSGLDRSNQTRPVFVTPAVPYFLMARSGQTIPGQTRQGKARKDRVRQSQARQDIIWPYQLHLVSFPEPKS